jgi:uncharacterized membrane protein YoaK (UPF0700 family)
MARTDGALIANPETALAVACVLTLTGGFLDAFTYLDHGRVFANVMSANVVLLGVFAVSEDWPQALKHVPPLIAFMLGVVAAQVIRLPAIRLRKPALVALGIEIAILAALSFLPRSFPHLSIVSAIAFAVALQHASFTRVIHWSYNSVMTTVNLRIFTENLFAAARPSRTPEIVRQAYTYGAICLSFMSGGVIGALATRALHNTALWVPVVLLALVLLRVAYPHKEAAGGDIQAPS